MSGPQDQRPRPDDRIAALADRYDLPSRGAASLGALLEHLVEDPFAPTSVVEPSQAIDDHLADSLVALEVEQVRSAAMLADLGAGAGFPGLPLAIA